MDNKTALDKLPSRIKYYLLDWKDSNMEKYIERYGTAKLRDLTHIQLRALFSSTVAQDVSNLYN